MAITATHYRLFKSLPLPQGGSLLEIGEANWYGDVEPPFPCRDKSNGFMIAKDCYAATFAPSRCLAIDRNGTAKAWRYDLNEPLPCNPSKIKEPGFAFAEPSDVIINHGTAEHIFNIAQVVRTMHDACADGGLMVHDAPFTGWINHGFYCLQPTLFYDLAAANNYEVVKVAVHAIEGQKIIPIEYRDHVSKLAAAGMLPPNSMLFVALRKLYESPFKIPTQGYYAGKLSAAGNKAWEELR